MSDPIAQKLELFGPLSEEDRSALSRFSRARLRQFASHEDVIREGDRPRDLYLFHSGWACRYKQMEDGRRQIIAYALPGDLCDLNLFLLGQMDHSIGTITSVTVAQVSRDAFEEFALNHPRVVHAFYWENLVNAAIQREWTVTLGRRSAIERIAHLVCELFLRLRSVGLTLTNAFEWPITQVELADTTGMTSVHASRTLQELRHLGLVRLKDRFLIIADLRRLMQVAMFNPSYLHLHPEGACPNENAAEREGTKSTS
jgi:CRP-like cAMP-binding protein